MFYSAYCRIPFVSLVLCALVASPGFAIGGDSKPGSHRRNLLMMGLKRSYVLHVPSSYTGIKAVPLVLVLHGGLGSAGTGSWDSRMTNQSEKEGFVVVYPNGYLRTWNAGGCCGIARRNGVDDVSFVRTIIQNCKNELSIDPDRVYCTGISNGGMMAYRLARELSDQIAAIAPVEGCMYATPTASENPISVVAFHGERDHVVPCNGGIGGMMGYRLKSTPVIETIEYWRQWNKCGSEPKRSENSGVEKKLYSGGLNGTEVCLYSLPKAGHAWPGGRRAVLIGDRPSHQMSATEIMCDFFWAHPKRQI